MRRSHLPAASTPPVPLDISLSGDLLAALNQHVPKLCGRDQENLASFLKGEVDSTYANEALTLLWQAEPKLMARMETASASKKPDVGCMSASLFVWSLNQPWAESIDFKRLLSKWTGYTITKSAGQEIDHIPRACTYLNRLLPLIPQIPEAMRPRFVTFMYNELTWLTSKNESHAQLGQLMSAMGQLAERSPAEISEYFLSLPDQWILNTHDILQARNRPPSEKSSLSLDIAASTLSNDMKARALVVSPCDVWAKANVAAVLLPTLPVEDAERFEALPWAYEPDSQDPGAENRAILRMYCPSIAPIVEMAASDEDWLDKDAIAPLVEQFKPENTQAIETFALPVDMEPL